MVFGNMGETSATGVAFTRNPSTGANELYGEFLVNAQGEDVVAGIRTPQNITEAPRKAAGSDKPSLEDADAGGVQAVRRRRRSCSRSTTATCRTWSSRSSAASSGCCRRATASAPRAPRCSVAVDMANEGLITRDEAITRVEPGVARPVAASDDRPEGQAHADRDRPAGLARRGVRRDRVLRRRGRSRCGRRAARSILVRVET